MSENKIKLRGKKNNKIKIGEENLLANVIKQKDTCDSTRLNSVPQQTTARKRFDEIVGVETESFGRFSGSMETRILGNGIRRLLGLARVNFRLMVTSQYQIFPIPDYFRYEEQLSFHFDISPTPPNQCASVGTFLLEIGKSHNTSEPEIEYGNNN